MESTKVFKVKYGHTLRRFNAFSDKNGRLDLNMNGLRAKIISLFNLVPNADFTLTYTDEDGDVVTLVNDDDLHDMISQCMNVFRIKVRLNTENDGRSDTRSSRASNPMRSSLNLFPSQDTNAGFAEVLNSIPEPLLEAFSKLSSDLASKAATSAPLFSEILTTLSNLGEAYFNPVPPSGSGADNTMQNRPSTNPPSDNPIDSLVNQNTKASHACNKQDSTSKSNEVGTAVSVSGGAGTWIPPPTTSVDLNFPNFPDESRVWSFPDISKIPTSSVAGDGTITVGNTSNVTATDRNETEKVNDVPPVRYKGLFGKISSTRKESECAGVGCSECASDGMKGAKKVTHQGEKFAGSIPSRWSVGCSIPNSQDASHVNPLKTPSDGWNYSTPNYVNPFGDCPFTGRPLVNNSVRTTASHQAHLLRSFKDVVGGRFHKDVRCDGCGVQPITGPRFKSKVRENYDLCNICYARIGIEADYIKIDWPVRRHPLSFKMAQQPIQQPEGSARPYPRISCGVRTYQPNLDSRFILDVNVIDGTVMAPSIPFTKTWRMRNTGNAVWPRGTQLVWIGGDRFSEKYSVEICQACVPIGEEIEISVEFIAPEFPGRYISYWRTATPSGERFGQRVWVLIQVHGSMKDLLGDSMAGINLNLPPSSGGSQSPRIIDVNVEPVLYGDLGEASDPGKRIVEEHGDKDDGLNFPIDDNSLATTVPGTVSSKDNPSVSYPIIDFTDFISGLDQAALDQVAMEEAGKNSGEEQTLLKALVEMGFKCDEFNKEILRMHEYNLEETVNHLCGVGEWDPILEELQEMGFHDAELNKKLLRKNNGSIKRVVMDLIAVEKY